MASGDKAGKVKVELTLDLTRLKAQVEEARKIIGGIADAGVETGGRSTRRIPPTGGGPPPTGMTPTGGSGGGGMFGQIGFPAGGVPPIIPPTGGGPPPTGMTPTGGSGGGGMFGGLGTAGITQAMRQGGWVASVLSRLGIPASVASSFGLIAGTLTSAASAAAIPLAALAATLLSLRRAIKSANEAAELYAKTLQSGGLPLGFVSWRSSLASILGVSEDEVLSFSQAVSGLGERVKDATDTIARNAPELAKTTWEWRMLKLEWQAFWSEFSKAMSPVLRELLRALSQYFHLLGNVIGFLNKQRLALANWLKREMSERGLKVWGKVADFVPEGSIKEGMKKWLKEWRESREMSEMGLKFWGKVADFVPEGSIKEGMKKWLKEWRESISEAPPPTAWSRRLPGSDWERKGLVLGGFGMAGGIGIEEPSKQTANNTRETVKLLGKILSTLGKVFEPPVVKIGKFVNSL